MVWCGVVRDVKDELKELVRKVFEKGDVEGGRIRHVWNMWRMDMDVEFLWVLVGC